MHVGGSRCCLLSGSKYDISITTKTPDAIKWDTNWNPLLENGNCANASMSESHNDTAQDVIWIVEPLPSAPDGSK
jgi:hypothetical protein